LGTGCIFTYDDDDEHVYEEEVNGFKEESKPNFFGSSYSTVKGYTDMIMKMFDNVLNVRIRMPITDEVNSRNFITKITSYKKICSIRNSMTVLPELLPVMIDMCSKKITGTVNLTNPGLISHNEILEMYKEIVDNDFTWENFNIEEQRQILASERSNNYLDTTRLESIYKVKHIKDSVREILYKMKEVRQVREI
jgi:3,5-epimerase/4-reductase